MAAGQAAVAAWLLVLIALALLLAQPVEAAKTAEKKSSSSKSSSSKSSSGSSGGSEPPKRPHVWPAMPEPVPAKWFSSWFQDEEAQREIVAHLQQGLPVQIRNVLRPDLALRVYAELVAVPQANWTRKSGYEAGFQFQYSHLEVPVPWQRRLNSSEQPPLTALEALVATLDSVEMKAWVSDIVGANCLDPAVYGYSWFQPGDYISPHTDQVSDPDQRETRMRVMAYTLHLTRRWQQHLGGDLLFLPSGDMVPPTFNSLTLFPVHAGSLHQVTPVAQLKQGADKRRLAFHGWWLTGSSVRTGELYTFTARGPNRAPASGSSSSSSNSQQLATFQGFGGARLALGDAFDPTSFGWEEERQESVFDMPNPSEKSHHNGGGSTNKV